jgi:hypothetical protein
VDRDGIIERRLLTTRLNGERVADPAKVVRWFGAMQAQEYEPAQWSIGMRTVDEDAVAVSDALATGRIVRLHILRPTWHFVAAEDHSWVVEATGEAVDRRNSSMYRNLELDTRTLRRTNDLIVAALCGDGHLTRKAMAERLSSAGVEAKGQRLAYIVMHAELRGLICSGAMQGKQHTYALVEERIPSTSVVDHDEALRRLAVRYFESHGPALVRDFRWWAHIHAADTATAMEAAAPSLDSETVGRDTWWFGSAAPAPVPATRRALMLQGYDEYFSYKDKRLVDPDPNVRILPTVGMYYHASVVDGRVVGNWRRTFTDDEVRIDLVSYGPLRGAAKEAVRDATDRYARFVGRRPVLAVREA